MPPIRTQAAKPLKTERTHEENQERAYIAASRRSDRSLEARIESARRASEIHKKRTGRALRVTEQDVVNEEMYEEEEEDMPYHYRRLQAYMAMQNSGDVFNGRLNSYLISTAATRMMMGGMGMPGMGMGMPPPHNPTPFFSYTPPQLATPGHVSSPQSIQPTSVAQLARPALANPGGQHSQQPQNTQSPSRKTSTTSADGSSSSHDFQQLQEPRRATVPMLSPGSQPNSSVGQAVSPVTPNSSGSQSVHQSPTQGNFFASAQQGFANNQQYAYPSAYSAYDPTMGTSMGNMYGTNFNLLSQTLPVEAQQMFGTNTFNPSDGFSPSLMNLNHGMPVPPNGLSYSYNPNITPANKPNQNQQTTQGMNQTLSQSAFVPTLGGVKALDYQKKNSSLAYPGGPPISTEEPPSSAYDRPFGFESYADFDGDMGDGTRTPGDFFSDMFDSTGGQEQQAR